MKYKILIICSILFLLDNTSLLAKIQSVNNDTTVSYEPTPEQLQRYFLELTVMGNGSVFDGTTPIENGSITYEMIYSDSKSLTIVPKKNSYLKKVIVDGVLLDTSKMKIISISHMERDMTVMVEFEDHAQEEEPESPKPEKPNTNNEIENIPIYDKDVVIIITQDIPLAEIPNEITENFIRRYLNINDDYEILSHNIQNKPGVYEIMIRLSDGSVRKVKIKVVDSKQEENEKCEVVSEECRVHIVMLILLLIYVSCNIVMIVKTVSKINKLKQRQGKEDNDEI